MSDTYDYPSGKVYDLNKHGDEFRLRLLVTNECDKDCSFCLNDFQDKPMPWASHHSVPKYIDPVLARDYIRAYAAVVEEKCKHMPLINISGGEPGLHPDLLKIVQDCAAVRGHAMLNTNGLVFKHRDWKEISENIGHLRIHVRPHEKKIPYNEMGVCRPMSFQAVYTGVEYEVEYEHIIRYYGARGQCVKFFVNFYGNKEVNNNYELFIFRMRERYPQFKIEARFTGVQQNRGVGCLGCTSKCITLKALWVFPEGSSSPCPQDRKNDMITPGLVYRDALNAYNFHKLNDESGSQGNYMASLCPKS